MDTGKDFIIEYFYSDNIFRPFKNLTHKKQMPSGSRKHLFSPNKNEVMQAIIISEKEKLEYRDDVPMPEAPIGECLVRVKAAALNHRDVWILQGQYAKIVLPAIVGSDGAGEYEGRGVLINPSIGWGDNPAIQAKGYQILGMPQSGTLADWVAVPRQQLYELPPHLSWEEAAALPLAGLTAFRAVFTKGQIRPGDKVLVTGIGGGVALFAMQFAVAVGASVYVSSGSDEKIEKARALGAAGGVNYRSENWSKILLEQSGGFDLVIDGAAGEGLAQVLKCCNAGARVAVYGGGQGVVPALSPQLLFWKQISILGTSMGTDREFAEMLDFVNRHQIKPVIDSRYSLKEGAAAFQRMKEGRQFGKIILLPE
jgi:zinc-binding alcohol dehydrogenase/oxidoreductase